MNISNYPTEPAQDLTCDVIIPYWQHDRHIAKDALRSILIQKHVLCHIHLIADGCQPISTPTSRHHIYHYSTPGNYGPYAITNSIISYLQTPFMALQDADDLSLANRLWKQLTLLSSFDCTSCAMQQEPCDGYDGYRHIRSPILYPGVEQSTCPLGRCINSTRTMTVSCFKNINGFAALPTSADYHLDNRLLYTKQRVHGSEEILAIRRLRPVSLSNGGRYRLQCDLQKQVGERILSDVADLNRSPSLELARAQGDLDKSHHYPLEVIGPSRSLSAVPDQPASN